MSPIVEGPSSMPTLLIRHPSATFRSDRAAGERADRTSPPPMQSVTTTSRLLLEYSPD